ncbi:MAG TPA: type VI secretion system ImpA family N-terminal domain-containing protein [Longimicrobium sp.]|nr:type VI secretion system ImpA family N-terminal domain-containing protein [Longimicrobium sp.]
MTALHAAPAPASPDARLRTLRAQIRDALRAEDASVPRGIWDRPLKRADPRLAAALALDALENGGHDLQVAAFLVQAWVMTDGFAGARKGLHLVHGLCDGHHPHGHDGDSPDHLEHDPGHSHDPGHLHQHSHDHDHGHPHEHSHDRGHRHARDHDHGHDHRHLHEYDPAEFEVPFAWMATHVAAELGRVDLTRPASGAPVFTWEQWQAAVHRDHVQRAASERPAPGEATQDDVLEAAARTPTRFYLRAERELADTVDAVEALQELLRHHGPCTPSLGPLHRKAAEIRAWVRARLAERPAAEPEPCPDEPECAAPDDPCEPDDPDALDDAADAEERDRPLPVPCGATGIRGRDEAYALLDAAAAYLARTEPHSPTPWLVRRAVAWGRLELGELLEMLIAEGHDLKTLRLLLGLAAEGRS